MRDARQLVDAAQKQGDEARARADRLAAQLRALGVQPDS
jgi:hypothetical protein